ncbi:MAG TPA: hypothetical protein DCW90_19040 [Lachnospiraceae bacterium]|nr:hypothetical protein [Lachnospiraceae bacterium]
MKKLQNETLQRFVDIFVQELKRENDNREYHETKKLNIPFILSSLHQSFSNNPGSYKEFISDLGMYPDYNIEIEDSKNDYDGIIDVEISLIKYQDGDYNYYRDYDSPSYNYEICFSYDERNWGYCECTPDMEDYREDKKCCGHGCDASFCSFSLHKINHIVSDSWHGDEHDYWDFEDEFYMDDKELADKKNKEETERKIRELQKRISADSKKLAELTSDFPVDVDEELDKYKKTIEFMKKIGI